MEAVMSKHKSLLVALAAVGLAGGASAPRAQFANVFVPELAAIDALCRSSRAGGFPLVRLAQSTQDKGQTKTEISAAAPAAVESAPGAAPRIDEPPLLHGIG